MVREAECLKISVDALLSEDGGIWDTRRLLSAPGAQMRKAGGRGHRATPRLRVRGSRHMLETHLVAESTGHEVPGGFGGIRRILRLQAWTMGRKVMSLLTEEPQRRNGFDGQEDELLWGLTDPTKPVINQEEGPVCGSLEPIERSRLGRERRGRGQLRDGRRSLRVNKSMWERDGEPRKDQQ